jgi:hypothetical protein
VAKKVGQRMVGLRRRALVILVLTVGLQEQRKESQPRSTLVAEWAV